jgi:hypothetical protein
LRPGGRIGHVEDHGCIPHGGNGIAQQDEPIMPPNIVWVEVGRFQHGGGVAGMGGHQRREPSQ